MSFNKGKKFEQCVVNSFEESFPEGTIDRIYDTEGKKYGIKNICDYIGYIYPNIFYLEAKSLKGNTFNLARLTQYDKLCAKSGIKGVCAGVVIWFIEHKRVVFATIDKITELKQQGKKSVNIRHRDDYTIEFPVEIKRVYPKINFQELPNILPQN